MADKITSSLLFTEQQDLTLIELVKARPLLFDPDHEQFKNIVEKHKAWERISATLELPVTDVKKRWRHFRDHYLKKVKMHKAGRYRPGREPWRLMKKLTFLSKISSARRQSPAVGAEQWHFTEESLDSDEEYGSSGPAEPEGEPEPHASCREEPPPAQDTERSAVHKFFEAMADVVAQFPPRLAAHTRLQVCRLVTDAELQLHAAADVCNTLDLPPIPLHEIKTDDDML